MSKSDTQPHVWHGKWIDAGIPVENRVSPIFRRVFDVPKDVQAARVAICGLGLFELRINGNLPDDSVLNPAHTQYSQTVLYRVFDAAKLISPGTNRITVELGNGFYNENGGVWNWQNASWRSSPKLILDLILCYADGTEDIVSTDESWEVTTDGPTRENGIYQGETFDAGRSDSEKFRWYNARLTDAPAGKLKEQEMPPIRRIAEIEPDSVRPTSDGSYLISLPEMVTGWAKLKLSSPCGVETIITYGEQLDESGRVQKTGKGEGRDGSWWPDYYLQQDRFISGGYTAEFEPKFSYKGFQYIQVENYPGVLTKDDVTVYRVANDMDVISEFTCSDEQINRLHRLMRRTLLNNFQGKPTDTPVWEKNGWLGDANCALTTMLYNFDMREFLTAFLDTMADCQHEYGTVPIMVPTAGWGTGNSPVWNTVFVFGAEALYDHCNAVDTVRRLYPDLREMACRDIAEIREKGWIWDSDGLADWISPSGGEGEPTVADPSEGAEICGTAFIYAMLKSMVRLAEAIGRAGDAEEYRVAMDQIYRAFNAAFFRPEQGIYETSCWREIGKRTKYRQTSNLLPLAFGLVPEERIETVAGNLAKDVRNRGYHLDTGCIGTRFILPVLCDHHYGDIAYRLLTQTTYPSWGFWLTQNSTTAWETWETTTRSKDHYFLGTYDEFLYTHLAGIRDIRDAYRSFTVAPAVDFGLTFVKAAIRTPLGRISCAWERAENGEVTVEVEIPQGSEAKIRLAGREWVEKAGKYTYRIASNGILD